MIGPRLVEACALLPLLHLPPDQKTIVACVGPQAEILASDCLRWHDVVCVLLLEQPMRLKDKRVSVVPSLPPAGCDAVLVAPGADPLPYLTALKPAGILCASTMDPERVPALLASLRKAFPRDIWGKPRVVPWRENLPEPIFGALASQTAPLRRRGVPKGSVRISGPYLQCMFTFGRDEMPLVLDPSEGKLTPTPTL